MKQTFAKTLLLGIVLALGSLPALAQGPKPAASQPAYTANGERTCLTCHGGNPKVTAILQSPMALKGDKHTPFGQSGCESCHGASADHASGKAPKPAIVFAGPNASPVSVRNEVCMNCHQGGLRMNWEGSTHENNNKACTDCHTSHAAKDPVLAKTTQTEVCFTCHSRQRTEALKYSHHPMREGKVVCSDCHNPHGAAGDTKMLKEFTINQTCYNCHADKRGPLLWEHQPVRDNCLNCHTPHGSNEPRLMKERANFLCAACHSGTGNSHGGAFGGSSAVTGGNPAPFGFQPYLSGSRTCMNCHSAIHGSNSPNGSFFFR